LTRWDAAVSSSTLVGIVDVEVGGGRRRRGAVVDDVAFIDDVGTWGVVDVAGIDVLSSTRPFSTWAVIDEAVVDVAVDDPPSFVLTCSVVIPILSSSPSPPPPSSSETPTVAPTSLWHEGRGESSSCRRRVGLAVVSSSSCRRRRTGVA
jgi:hypothetical protein